MAHFGHAISFHKMANPWEARAAAVGGRSSPLKEGWAMSETSTAVATIDSARAEAFAGQMMGVLNHGFLALLVSVGHRTRLFETMAGLPPATSEGIANAAGLHERYVREWLGGMVAGGIVEYAPETQTYGLPQEHAACLTSAAGADNLAMFTQYIALCGLVEDQVVTAFTDGRGVPYSAYSKFQQLQAEESAMTYGPKLVSTVLPLAPGVIEALQTGADVLDLGCGQGAAIILMARAFPRSRFTGWDFAEGAVQAARVEAERLGLTNARFEVRDLASLDASEAYDLITTFDVVHDLAKPDEVLRQVARGLRREGTFLMADIAVPSGIEHNREHPVAPMLYAASVFHCLSVSLHQGGPGLGTLWGEENARAMLDAAGFSVEVKHLEGDIFHAFFVARKR
jgi:2-polyprenyl-3-methyl-5-hydroxy-6-metoxy-1,4-benzoquinol methylase